MLGFDFYKDPNINNESKEYYLENSKYLKKLTPMNIKYFGGLALSYYEIEIEEDPGRIHKISYPAISYNVKFVILPEESVMFGQKINLKVAGHELTGTIF